MHLTVFVISHGRELHLPAHPFVVNDDGRRGGGLHHHLQNAEKFARIASTETQKCFVLTDFYLLFLQDKVFGQRAVAEREQIFFAQSVKREDLAA